MPTKTKLLNIFHVSPIDAEKVVDRYKWIVFADKRTTLWLFGGGSVAKVYRTRAEALAEGRRLQKEFAPAELIWHRHPRKGESPNLFPIQGRSTVPRSADPRSSRG